MSHLKNWAISSRRKSLNAKRKMTDLIIDDLDEEERSNDLIQSHPIERNLNKVTDKKQIPSVSFQSSPEIEDHNDSFNTLATKSTKKVPFKKLKTSNTKIALRTRQHHLITESMLNDTQSSLHHEVTNISRSVSKEVSSPEISDHEGFNEPLVRKVKISKEKKFKRFHVEDLFEDSEDQENSNPVNDFGCKSILKNSSNYEVQSPNFSQNDSGEIRRFQSKFRSSNNLLKVYDVDDILEESQTNGEEKMGQVLKPQPNRFNFPRLMENKKINLNRSNYILNEIEGEYDTIHEVEQHNEDDLALNLSVSKEMVENFEQEKFQNNFQSNAISSSEILINEDFESRNEDLIKQNTDTGVRIKGTDWLKELQDTKFITTDVTFNQTVNCMDVTSNLSESMFALNTTTSDALLGEGDLKRKKMKFIKHGYAEKLQKLLIRQTSSLNFIRHNMNKEKNDKFKNIGNTLKVLPIYKQSAFNKHYYLIHGFELTDIENLVSGSNSDPKYTCVLVANEFLDSSRILEAGHESNFILNIYPPWKKMCLDEYRADIFFCTNLIEITQLSFDSIAMSIQFKIIKQKIYDTMNSTGERCLMDPYGATAECDLSLFDSKTFLLELKKSISIDRLKRSGHNKKNQRVNELNGRLMVSQNCMRLTQNYLFFTQTDAAYYNNVEQRVSQRPQEVESQFMRVNSILDALENIGYYGFVTFIATVQRIDDILVLNILSQRKQVIISDKCGTFALIIFPMNTGALQESHKYQFNSLKFLEKQTLSQKETNPLDKQFGYLWSQMNSKRKQNSMSTLKTNPKIIYVFEYLNETRSTLDFLGISKNYLESKNFTSLMVARQELLENNFSLFFNLNNVIALKLYEKDETSELFLYFLVQTYHGIWKIESIRLESLRQFSDYFILSKLKENFFISQFNSAINSIPTRVMLQLNNVSLSGTDSNKNTNIQLNACSSFSKVHENADFISELETNLQVYDILTTCAKNLFENNLSLNDFVQISGQIINICDEDCVFELTCIKCKRNLNMNYYFENYSNITYDGESNHWICDTCGVLKEDLNEEPILNIQMQVILNCTAVTQLVKVNFHLDTISKIIPTQLIKESFKKESDEEIFDADLVIGKEIGPLFGFITNLTNSQINVDELCLFEDSFN